MEAHQPLVIPLEGRVGGTFISASYNSAFQGFLGFTFYLYLVPICVCMHVCGCLLATDALEMQLQVIAPSVGAGKLNTTSYERAPSALSL